MELRKKSIERRSKYRFEMKREMRYKVTGDGAPPVAGNGSTVNMGSGGVAFATEHALKPGAFVELSIHWPVLLDDSCPMRLIVFGRVLRAQNHTAVCSIDKYEFRTAARTFQAVAGGRSDGMLQRWADGMRKESLKDNLVRV
jgi:hypothetical protein